MYVWEHCTPIIAIAIERFSDRWGPYSHRSRRYSIYRLLKELIDPAWRTYLTHLPSGHRAATLCGGSSISEMVRSMGFRALEDKIISIAQVPGSKADLAIADFIRPRQEIINGQHVRFPPSVDEEFDATIETMRGLIVDCRLKTPAKERVRDLSVDRGQPNCDLCGCYTELEAYRRGAAWPDLDPDLTARLSKRYCSYHRPVRLDGTSNSNYRRAFRSRQQFDEETHRLTLQTTSASAAHCSVNNSAVEAFLFNVVGPKALYPDEEAEIRNEARRLVDARLSDRKKQIVILAATGLTQAEIGRRLGMSRQAVSKALNSVPKTYRFDNRK